MEVIELRTHKLSSTPAVKIPRRPRPHRPAPYGLGPNGVNDNGAILPSVTGISAGPPLPSRFTFRAA